MSEIKTAYEKKKEGKKKKKKERKEKKKKEEKKGTRNYTHLLFDFDFFFLTCYQIKQ